MATVELQGTRLTCEILAPEQQTGEARVCLRVAIKNEYLSYEEVSRKILLQDMEEWIVSMSRLLAGAYAREYNLVFEQAGLAVDLYPNHDGGKGLSRADRRNSDCMMAIRLLMHSADRHSFLGGVYTLLFHKEEISAFCKELSNEFEKAYSNYLQGKGTLTYVGVSPLGYRGCSYWYFADSALDKAVIDGRELQKGDFVWVRMGRRNLEQIVHVDVVRLFTEETAPYDSKRVKRVLKVATKEEVALVQASLNENK